MVWCGRNPSKGWNRLPTLDKIFHKLFRCAFRMIPTLITKILIPSRRISLNSALKIKDATNETPTTCRKEIFQENSQFPSSFLWKFSKWKHHDTFCWRKLERQSSAERWCCLQLSGSSVSSNMEPGRCCGVQRHHRISRLRWEGKKSIFAELSEWLNEFAAIWPRSQVGNFVSQRLSSPRTALTPSNSSSNPSTSAATKKTRRRIASMAQRRAANIRERRRMFNLNEGKNAMSGLRFASFQLLHVKIFCSVR